MKLNIIRNSVKVLALLLGTAFVVAACQRDEILPMEYPLSDGVIRFAPGIAAVSGDNGQIKSAVSVDEATEACVLTSEDGTTNLPIFCEVMPGIGTYCTSDEDVAGTKATLINDPGSETGAVKPLENFASSIDSTFWVSAWNTLAEGEKVKIIPDNPTGTALAGYVSGSATNGWYQKVAYRDGVSSSKYWMTIQKQTDTVTGAPTDADDEYIWKKDEIKTFFAYANLPSSGASISNTSASSQTLTLTALPDKDILLGYYSGNGYSGEPAKMTGTAGIHFYHPLTAVKFKKGTLSEGVTITGISINGVYTSGKTTQSATAPSTFNWTKTNGSAYTAVDQTGTASLSSVTVDANGYIGEAIVLIPETFANAQSRIAVTLSTPAGDKTAYYPLKGKTWSAGCTNVLTIGYDTYEFTFELAKSEDATQTFTNTTADSPQKIIEIICKKTDTTGETAEDWRIRSYTIGSGTPVDVRSTSFTGGGLSVSKSGDNLEIKALTRTSNYGTHDYWVNSMNRTDMLDWSPAAWSGVTDLSRLDFRTEKQYAHQMTTANCYVIRHAGIYKLPLVYGNAVQGGIEYSDAYSPTMAAGGDATCFLSPFQNHLGNGITSAFIENNTGCTAASADVVWQDNAAVIKDVSIEGTVAGTYNASTVRYLRFTVDEASICQNNAVIAVKDGSGNIMWSWHIWTTNDPALLSAPIAVTNFTGVEYDFFPINALGLADAHYLERDDVTITLEQTNSGKIATLTVEQPFAVDAGNGCWYQFGRKDPMCPKDSPVKGDFTSNVAGGTTLSGSILNPGTFYNGNTNDWLNVTYSNLWTGKKSVNGPFDQDADMIKTIYDPSPVGYKMPASKAFTGFTLTGDNTKITDEFNVAGDFDRGWNFYTKPGKVGDLVFFPALGSRKRDDGSITNVGFVGLYWSAIQQGFEFGYCLGHVSDEIQPVGFTYRASGFSVRPVQEP